MMRIASVFSKLKRPLAGAALLLMAGCAGGQGSDKDTAAPSGHDSISSKSLILKDLLGLSITEIYSIPPSDMKDIYNRSETLTDNEWARLLETMDEISSDNLYFDEIRELVADGCVHVGSWRENDFRADSVSLDGDGKVLGYETIIIPRLNNALGFINPDNKLTYHCLEEFLPKVDESKKTCDVIRTLPLSQEGIALFCEDSGKKFSPRDYSGPDYYCALLARSYEVEAYCYFEKGDIIP